MKCLEDLERAPERSFGLIEALKVEVGGADNGEILADQVMIGSQLAFADS